MASREGLQLFVNVGIEYAVDRSLVTGSFSTRKDGIAEALIAEALAVIVQPQIAAGTQQSTGKE